LYDWRVQLVLAVY